MHSYHMLTTSPIFYFFFFNDTATTEIYTLSLHDALPIWNQAKGIGRTDEVHVLFAEYPILARVADVPGKLLRDDLKDRKSTRLNSSHVRISYAVFCLKKKKHSKTATVCHNLRW